MNYGDFVSQLKSFPLIGYDVLDTLGGERGYWRLKLNRWTEQGKLIRLKRGLYTLPENLRVIPFSLRWLANTLYSPSYLSLEYALSHYDLIPDRVHTFTSVTRLKTMTIQNQLGQFSYQHLKKELFFGFEEREDEYKNKVLIATKEKALLDFIYLSRRWESAENFLENNVRLQGLETLNKKKFKNYAGKFRSKKMKMAMELILSKM